jgi:hypothetical protein
MQQTNNTIWVNDMLNSLSFTVCENLQYKRLILQEHVCELLKWNAEQFIAFQEACFLRYLLVMTNDEVFTKELAANKKLWNWWVQHWIIRDENNLVSNLWQLPVDNCIDIYAHIHNADHLAHEIYPEGVLLGESYHAIIGKIVKRK